MAMKKASKKTTARESTKSSSRGGTGRTGVLTAGKVVPDFVAPITGGGTFRLRDLKGKMVVLYFYPKDSTPGCTQEGHDFSRLKGEFEAANAVVIGISRDSLASHERFKTKENYAIDLMSDQDEKVCALFRVIKMKNMYGRQVRGVERSTFVIGSDGIVTKEWRGVKVAGHAEEVLDYVRSL